MMIVRMLVFLTELRPDEVAYYQAVATINLQFLLETGVEFGVAQFIATAQARTVLLTNEPLSPN